MAFDEQNSGAISQINVTPLVDVMLVLLVIFMVTAPILQQGVNVQLPRTQADELPGEEPGVVVSLTVSGELYMNDTRVSRKRLAQTLRAIVQERPTQRVFLRADRAVSYGEVMKVIAAVKAAGVRHLGMITEPPGR